MKKTGKTPSEKLMVLFGRDGRGNRASRRSTGDSVVTKLVRGTGSTVIRLVEFARKNPFNPAESHTRKHKFQALIFALGISLAVSVTLLATRALDGVEAQFFDWKVNLLADNDERDKDIVIIAIDETALAELAANKENYGWVYPWPRFVYNGIIKYCEEGGAKAVVFDFLFSDSGHNTNILDSDAPDRAWDDLFACEAISRSNVIVGTKLSPSPVPCEHEDKFLAGYSVPFTGPTAQECCGGLRGASDLGVVTPLEQLVTGQVLAAAMVTVRHPDGRKEYVPYVKLTPEQRVHAKKQIEAGFLAAVAERVADAAAYRGLLPDTYEPRGIAGIGSVDAYPDAVDGVFRRYNLAVAYKGHVLPSLALEALRVADGTPRGIEVLSNGDWKVGKYVIPADEQGRILLNFRGRMPARDVLGAESMTDEQLAENYPEGSAPWVYRRLSAFAVLHDWRELYTGKEWTKPEKRAEHAAARAQHIAKIEAARAAGDEAALRKLGQPPPEEPPAPKLMLGNPHETVGGKIVLVAGTAASTYDIRPNPLSRVANGVELHAAAIDMIRNGDFLLPAPAIPVVLITLLLGVLTATGVIFLRSYKVSMPLAAALGGVAILMSLAAYKWLNIDWPVAVPAIAGPGVAFMSAAVLKFFTLDAHTRQLRSFSEQYMGSELVDHVIRHPEALRLGGEKRPMTIYFSDIAGFTTISETLDPERLTELLNVYLSAMTEIVLRHDGIIDKYIGDAVMALWGAPKLIDDHAVRSCRAALAMRAKLHELQPKLKEIAPQLVKLNSDGRPLYEVLHARAGVNTGIVTAGNMGSNIRFSYTVMGDAVNQAARFEGANKEYGSWIMIGEATEELVRGQFVTRPLDFLVVKGKTLPKKVFELLAEGDMPDDQTLMRKHYCKGFDLYQAHAFEAALKEFEASAALETHKDSNPSLVYVKRCRHFIAEPPPPEWDGVFVLKTK